MPRGFVQKWVPRRRQLELGCRQRGAHRVHRDAVLGLASYWPHGNRPARVGSFGYWEEDDGSGEDERGNVEWWAPVLENQVIARLEA